MWVNPRLSSLAGAGEVVSVLGAGAITGVIVALLFSVVLPVKERWKKITFGFLSLPLGAFCFGVILSLVQLGIKEFLGISYECVQRGFIPFRWGVVYATLSMFTPYAVVLIPLSVLTTFGLNSLLDKKQINNALHSTEASSAE